MAMHIHIKRGLDIDIAGKPAQRIENPPAPSAVAVLGTDYPGVRPVLAVSAGQTVALGETLFTAAHNSDIRITAPAAGEVVAIEHGARRHLAAIEIAIQGSASISFAAAERNRTLDAASLREILLESGLWAAIRARPFDEIADPHVTPRALIVNAVDTSPLAPDPSIVIAERPTAFHAGVRALSMLSERSFLCSRPSLDVDAAAIGAARHVTVTGPHPAGLVGTQIRYLTAPTREPVIWHVGYQDAIAVGELLRSGGILAERIVSLAGAGVARPRLLRTRLGVSLRDLAAGECVDGTPLVSGSPLAGRRAGPKTTYLGRYDIQVSAMLDRNQAAGSQLRLPQSEAPGMLAVEAFERVWPFAGPPIPLLRALLCGDLDRAYDLGCLAMNEEDLALCSYVCPSRIDYGAALKDVLRELRSGI